MPRSVLLKSVTYAFLLLAFGFLFVLFSSLGNISKEPTANVFTDLREGQTVLQRVSGMRLWVTRLNSDQRHQLQTKHMCKESQLCALAAATKVAGIELVFIVERPPQLSKDLQWTGGFINPTNGNVYNIGGESYSLENNAKIADLVPVPLN